MTAAIDVVDSIEIKADARKVYDVVANYPAINSWFPFYRCKLVGSADNVIRVNSRVKHKIGRPLVISQFTRTIRVLVPGQRIEETYDEGQLIGTGIWTFTQNQDKTIAAYHCAVKANTLLVNIGFKVSGALGHHLVYNSLLQALKKHCEGGNGVV